MSTEFLSIDTTQSKTEVYKLVAEQLNSLVDTTNPAGSLAHFAALLKDTFQWWWIGVYYSNGSELQVGPYQGPLACSYIAFNRGVCGHAYTTAKSIVVPDVEEFPGHIACSSASKSEIVVPILNNGMVIGVIDADSEFLNHFDDDDRIGLESLASIIAPLVLSLCKLKN